MSDKTGLQERVRLRRANARLRKALEFYADPETYFAISFLPDPPCGDFVRDFERMDDCWRPGKRARAALNRITP